MRCVNTCASTDGARRAQNCALYTSVCFVVSVPLFAMCSRLFMSCVKMYAVCRSQMFVNMRCRIHSLYIKGTQKTARGPDRPGKTTSWTGSVWVYYLVRLSLPDSPLGESRRQPRTLVSSRALWPLTSSGLSGLFGL